MNSTVTVILPVCDLQDMLKDRVHRILDALPELTSQFEVMIVDHGSSDETLEVAAELSTSFPQVDFLDGSGDAESAVEDGLRRTSGEVIFVHDPTMPFSFTSMRRLWEMRSDDELVMARSKAHHVLRGPHTQAKARAKCALQMIRRRAIDDMRSRSESYAVPSFERFTRTDLAQHSLDESINPNLVARLRRFVSTG